MSDGMCTCSWPVEFCKPFASPHSAQFMDIGILDSLTLSAIDSLFCESIVVSIDSPAYLSFVLHNQMAYWALATLSCSLSHLRCHLITCRSNRLYNDHIWSHSHLSSSSWSRNPWVSALSGTLLADCGVLLQLVWTPEWPDFVSTMGGLSFCIWACNNADLEAWTNAIERRLLATTLIHWFSMI